MNRFLVGLSVGMPLGMLLADTYQERQWQRRAREWMSSARERVEDAGQRIRHAVEKDLRKSHGEEGRSVADLVDRSAAKARRTASAQTEHALLNSIGRDELLSVYGIGPVLADRIINGRPYQRDRDVLERGIVNERVFAQLRRQVLEKHRRPA